MPALPKKLSILYLDNRVSETSTSYNEFSLPASNRHAITICTYFATPFQAREDIDLRVGDGTISGFMRRVRAILREKSFDIIHVHTPHTGVMLLLAVIGTGGLMQRSVFTVHNSYSSFKARNKLLLLPCFAFFRRVVCCSASSLDSFPGIYRRLAGKRLCHVQNGVDVERVDRITAGLSRNPGSGSTTIVSVGRLIPIKNPKSLVDAFAQSGINTCHLRFIGAGALRDDLVRAAAAHGLSDRVAFSGLIPRADVYRALYQADLFVSTSFGEGLPIAVLEAMACGCPVILSDIPPHREIAAACDAVILVAPSDISGFAREINRIMLLRPEQRSELGRQCRDAVEAHFSVAAMLRGYGKIYDDVAGDRTAHTEHQAVGHAD